MRVAIISGGKVANIIEADSTEAAAALFPGAEVIEADGVGIEWEKVNGVWTPPAPPAKQPRIILAGWFKAAISRLGHTARVNAAVALQPEWKQILWNAATHVRENDTDVMSIAAALNIDLSEVFDEADRIRIETRG